MENYSKFEKLKVWNHAHKFVLMIYKLTDKFPSDEKYLLVSQLRRSASSVPTNIAEGNEKRTTKEFTQYLYIAKGSLAETKYHLLLAKDLGYIKEDFYTDLSNEANNIGKLLNGLINYLRLKSKD